MDAMIKVTAGSVRLFNIASAQPLAAGERLPEHVDLAAPAEQAVSGDWAVGQVPFAENGYFIVVPAQDGVLRVFEEYHDPSTGSVAPSNESQNYDVKAGEEREFKTTNSNAYKVSTGF